MSCVPTIECQRSTTNCTEILENIQLLQSLIGSLVCKHFMNQMQIQFYKGKWREPPWMKTNVLSDNVFSITRLDVRVPEELSVRRHAKKKKEKEKLRICVALSQSLLPVRHRHKTLSVFTAHMVAYSPIIQVSNRWKFWQAVKSWARATSMIFLPHSGRVCQLCRKWMDCCWLCCLPNVFLN